MNEACGLVQWVDKTDLLRSAINRIYAQKNMSTPVQWIMDLYKKYHIEASKPQSGAPDVRIRVFKEVLERHPPVLHHYFLEYPNPTKWLQVRTTFTRSLAVMSMVGFVVGYATL